MIHVWPQNRQIVPLSNHQFQREFIGGKGIDFPGLQGNRQIRQAVVIHDLRMREPRQNIPVKGGPGLDAEALSVQRLKFRCQFRGIRNRRCFGFGLLPFLLCRAGHGQRRKERQQTCHEQGQNKYADCLDFHTFLP